MSKKFYVTTPLYYVNAKAHIGHAYTTVIADCAARFARLLGRDVFFLTGTDEHGEKIKKSAQDSGKTTIEFIDGVVEEFKKLWSKLNISYDHFIRTTDKQHCETVKLAIKKIYDKGDIYKEKYQGLYCLPCEAFWTKEQVKDTEGLCPDCGRALELIEEENYFFKLSKYQSWLLEHLSKNPDFIKPKSRFNEIKSFLEKNTLQDLCISRPAKRLTWGIEFPEDVDFVVYVWFDALLNYISAPGYSVNDMQFNNIWPADIHFMAKDIIRHHAVFWPIMLKALELEVPKTVFAHGWWKFDNQKMSKSLGNVVDPFDVIEQVGVDALRFFLLREIPVGLDGNFSWQAIFTRYNSDLANDFGNLVYRTLNMSEKYFDGIVTGADVPIPENFAQVLSSMKDKYIECFTACEFSVGIESVYTFISVLNKYIEDSKPWTMSKEGRTDELNNFLYAICEGIRICTVCLWPVMPQTCESVMHQLGIPADFSVNDIDWGIVKDYKIQKEQPLFPRIDVN
ncbi:MAG: methionine--tRNA ligase [Candidatus Omnitrophota bacterium]